jgi:hypothetical protein
MRALSFKEPYVCCQILAKGYSNFINSPAGLLAAWLRTLHPAPPHSRTRSPSLTSETTGQRHHHQVLSAWRRSTTTTASTPATATSTSTCLCLPGLTRPPRGPGQSCPSSGRATHVPRQGVPARRSSSVDSTSAESLAMWDPDWYQLNSPVCLGRAIIHSSTCL